MWAYLVEFAKIAPIITALVAVGGVSIAICQLRSNQKNQRESMAKSIFASISDLRLNTRTWRSQTIRNWPHRTGWRSILGLWRTSYGLAKRCCNTRRVNSGKRTYRGMWTCTVSISSIIQTSRKKTSPFTTPQCKSLCETRKPRTDNVWTFNAGVVGTSRDSPGVAGGSVHNIGVYGQTEALGSVPSLVAGVYGTGNVRPGVIGFSQSLGVQGSSFLGTGVRGTSFRSPGIQGQSGVGTGVQGTSLRASGVTGIS